MLAPTAGNVPENYYDQLGDDIVIEEIIEGYGETTEKQIEVYQEVEETPLGLEEIPKEKDVKEELELDYKVYLKEMGYYKNDYSDENINMRNAILRFQCDHNLKVDGIFGESSEKALRKRIQDENYQYSDIVSNVPTDKEWITINKSKRILTFYRGKEVIKKYPIAQGKTNELTPEGKFTIVNKYINPRWGGAGIAIPVAGGSAKNPLGYRWMGISHGGGGSYGIHGNNQPNSIGTDASMGCVRMINSDVEELFQLISLKTPVWIGTHEKLQEWGVHNKSYIN